MHLIVLSWARLFQYAHDGLHGPAGQVALCCNLPIRPLREHKGSLAPKIPGQGTLQHAHPNLTSLACVVTPAQIMLVKAHPVRAVKPYTDHVQVQHFGLTALLLTQ